ncbi:MAG: sulfotransferase family 2 domain-containing protein, partial [Paracoccaceae bacterium]
RRTARSPGIMNQMIEKGFRIERRGGRELADILSEFKDYRVVANIRNPYHRVLSSYLDKLNRYTRAFDRPVFYYGKMRQFLEGPASWKNNHRSMHHMQSRISFEALVDGLARHGVAFDNHFNLQVELLSLGRVEYDALFHLENLQEELLAGLRKFGVGDEFIGRLSEIPRKNTSKYNKSRDAFLTPPVREKIYDIYRRDFEALGYTR